MRQLLVQVPRGSGKAVLDNVKSYDGVNLAQFEANGSAEPLDLVIIYISNRKVEGLLAELQSFPKLQVTLIPQGVIALQPPTDQVVQQVKNVEEAQRPRSVSQRLAKRWLMERFSRICCGCGGVVWIGLFTNTSYLLVAAILIAPFAGLAMNVVIATVRGDRRLLKPSLLRYFAALAVSIMVAEGWGT